jgi:hypothetical protein
MPFAAASIVEVLVAATVLVDVEDHPSSPRGKQQRCCGRSGDSRHGATLVLCDDAQAAAGEIP